MKSIVKEYFAKTPIIAAAHEHNWKDAIESPAKVILCCSANIMTVEEKVKEIHAKDKIAFVHIDLSDGIGKDKSGVEFLAKCDVDGIISTRGNLVKYANELGLITVQRFFALDAKGISGIKELSAASHPDYIEIMPGVIGKIIRQFANGPIPVLVGGLIDTKEEIAEALSNGAVAISTSKKELWEI